MMPRAGGGLKKGAWEDLVLARTIMIRNVRASGLF